MNAALISIVKSANRGDLLCSAARYFPELGKLPVINIGDPFPDRVDLIFSGGGLLHGGWLERIRQAVEKPGRRVALWGVGLNMHGYNCQIFPEWLGKCALVGLRDPISPYRWTACPSCLHTAFDHPWPLVPAERPFSVYWHYNRPLDWLVPGEPGMSNGVGKSDDLRAVLQYLAGGKHVLTNSFHGAYWGLLLNRPVTIIEPFSNRFLAFKDRVAYANRFDWKSAKPPEPQPEYLDLCRQSNLEFYEVFKQKFGK